MTSSPLTKDQIPASAAPVRQTGKSRLSLWLNKLPKHKLPLNPSVAQAIKVEINDLESTSERLAGLIKQDPSLALTLYQYTQTKVKHKEGDIQSLVHMIGLMGLGHIEKTLSPTPKPLQMSPEQKAIYAASLFAANLAKQLMPLKHGTVGERFFLPTLFYNAPLWLMYKAAPTIMSTIQKDICEQGLAQKSVFRSRLGFGLEHLLKRSPKLLQLPQQTHQALAVDMGAELRLWATVNRLPEAQLNRWFEKNKTERHFFYSTNTGIFLVNQYVLALYFDLTGKQIERFTHLLCRHLHITEETLSGVVSNAAMGTKLPQSFDEDASPLFRIRGLHREEQNNLAPSPSKKKTISAIHTDPLVLLKNSTKADDALDLAQKAIIKAAEPNEVLIFRRADNAEAALELIHHFGIDGDINGLSLTSAEQGKFFTKILEKPMALLIKPEKVITLEKQLPRSLRQFWSPRSFSVMSLSHNQEPFAIMVCSGQRWGNDQHEQFKRVGKILTRSLKNCTR